jgi:hypothetical protein
VDIISIIFAAWLGTQRPEAKKIEIKVEQVQEVAEEPSSIKPEEPATTEQLIRNIFGEEANVAIAIAEAESGLRAEAVNTNRNGSIDRGLFQINSIHCKKFDCTRLFEREYNIEAAKQIKEGSGWTAWSTYKSGKYRKYL